ncbi:ABATE domain-containing protein [Embleya sp. NPDC050154]|uniref:ABATE domain-containing protein n=1 Tax=Embleya sp. NPDC050154 TaxID=3363988 RepID=UPI0037A5E451
MKETVLGEPARAAHAAHPVLPAAPGAERYLALDLANTNLALPGGQEVDLLGTPASAKEWLVTRELAPPDTVLYDVCAGRLRALRDEVRTLLSSRIGALLAPDASVRAINDALTSAPSAALLHWDEVRGPYRAQAHPVDQIVNHAIAILAADAADLLTGPDAERLAPCGATPCSRFLVRTHASRQWCSVRCGDRVRAARAYARRTQTLTQTQTQKPPTQSPS